MTGCRWRGLVANEEVNNISAIDGRGALDLWQRDARGESIMNRPAKWPVQQYHGVWPGFLEEA